MLSTEYACSTRSPHTLYEAYAITLFACSRRPHARSPNDVRASDAQRRNHSGLGAPGSRRRKREDAREAKLGAQHAAQVVVRRPEIV